MIRHLVRAAVLTSLLCVTLAAGELYYTGFESFPAGYDTIAGTDGWTGSSAHLTLNLSGVDTEADHLVAGIGNAAFIGGNAEVLPPSASQSYRTVNVRRAINVDPVALGQEVLQFHVNVGIKDSTGTGLLLRRDNFEFAFYNQSSQLIAFIQFDNSTLDNGIGAPLQSILRSNYNTTQSRWDKAPTGAVFLYDVLMELIVRINFRTNRWTATLDGVDIFSDEVFYSGTLTRNLGVVAAQMQIVGTGIGTGGQPGPAPGENYMLFDDFAVRADPVPASEVIDFSRDAVTGVCRLTWSTEAMYKYQVQYSSDLVQWKSDLAGSLITAATTGVSPLFIDSPPAWVSGRFYRVVPTYP